MDSSVSSKIEVFSWIAAGCSTMGSAGKDSLAVGCSEDMIGLWMEVEKFDGINFLWFRT
jgi:hypothetical protein